MGEKMPPNSCWRQGHLMPKLYIDNWEIKKVDECKTEVTNPTDVNSDQIRLSKSKKNVLARKASDLV